MTTSNRARAGVAGLALSAAAFVGFLQHEGFRDEAYHATAEEKARGINTIGFGTTEGVKAGDKIKVEDALVRALRDSAKFEGAIKRCVTVPLHQYEYDAYVSLAYNIGDGAFCSSTLVKKLNAEDYEGACAEISRWDKQGGVVLRGLTKRRAEERAKCEGKTQ
jgi:lysozyme